jgi:hypothetical protein
MNADYLVSKNQAKLGNDRELQPKLGNSFNAAQQDC